MLSRVLGILMMSAPFAALPAAMPPSAPAHGVRLENTWIPMSDGVRLAVTLYLPTKSKTGERYPALLEYLPYRKDDDEAVRDFGTHTYFARRGFVGARVDVRGFGMSEGSPPDREYSAQEQQDAEQVIAWLARQPWSNGAVGMRGISWGILPLVAGLFVLVQGLNSTGVVAQLTELLKWGVSQSAMATAWISGAGLAFGANLTNNLPAALIAESAVTPAYPPSMVRGALLIGVDLGPSHQSGFRDRHVGEIRRVAGPDGRFRHIKSQRRRLDHFFALTG